MCLHFISIPANLPIHQPPFPHCLPLLTSVPPATPSVFQTTTYPFIYHPTPSTSSFVRMQYIQFLFITSREMLSIFLILSRQFPPQLQNFPPSSPRPFPPSLHQSSLHQIIHKQIYASLPHMVYVHPYIHLHPI